MLGYDLENPDFVNEQGVKWWVDKGSTRYAQKENARGTTLNIVVYLAELTDGSRTYVLINEQQEIVHETQSLEEVGVHIDMLKLSKEAEAKGL